MKLIRLFLTLLFVAVSLPAQAHDQLIDQSPSDGDTLQAGVIELRLSFNNELLKLGDSGAEILVLNDQGEPQNPGCALIESRDASVKLDLSEAGEYSVAWRVVSSDGHPISGEFKFKLENSTGYEADPNFSFIECAEPVLISPAQEQDPTGYWFLWLSLGLVALGLFIFLRPKRKPGKED
jgi:methionine-rich copper-binding protein CopC